MSNVNSESWLKTNVCPAPGYPIKIDNAETLRRELNDLRNMGKVFRYIGTEQNTEYQNGALYEAASAMMM